MAVLVPIPWQPQYVLTPDTLTMLQLASAHAGHNIQVDDAWRSYAQQKYYYDGYINHQPGFNVASNPDTGQRNHMRGAAVDITDQADRGAMLTVGFTPDPVEWWHFNNPRWASMPIIPTNTDTTSVSGGGATPIQEADMPLTPADMNLLLNTPAFDNGPTVSVVLMQVNAVWQGLYGTGNPDVPGNGSIVGLIDSIPSRVWATDVQRAGVPVSALQELADAKTVALRIEANQQAK
jgi:hypothetical protein